MELIVNQWANTKQWNLITHDALWLVYKFIGKPKFG